MTLMVALVGGQPLPNFLLARHYKPNALLLVYTSTTQPVYKKLEATLKAETTVYEIKTDPYDIIAIVKALNNKLAEPELASQILVFNITGGTKAMSLAAYQVAQQHSAPVLYLESEGKQSRVYQYKWKKQQLQESTSEILPECIQLKDFLNLQLGPGKWTQKKLDNQPGSIFQKAVAGTLQDHEYEIMLSIQAMNGQVDVDIAVRFKNQFGIIETKMGNKGGDLDGIKQLSNAVRHLSTYTQTFYAITIERNKLHDAIVEAARIKVIS